MTVALRGVSTTMKKYARLLELQAALFHQSLEQYGGRRLREDGILTRPAAAIDRASSMTREGDRQHRRRHRQHAG